jgi:hypothetical protein
VAKAIKKFVYQNRDSSTVKARATQRSGDFDSIFKEGVKIFKPREGKNKIRILPPSWADPSHYGFEIFVNYGIGVDEQSYLSLSAMKNEPDPLAEARKQAERQGNKTLADSLKPTKRVMFYVIDRMAEDEGVQLWAAPWTIDKSFASLAIDEESGAVTMVDHPDEGHDITFYKEGTGMTTKYPAERMRISREPCPLSDDAALADEWLEQITSQPLPEVLNFYDYDHIAAAFDGQVRNDKTSAKPKGKSDDEDDLGEKIVKVKPTLPKTKLAKVDDDEIDEDTGEVTPKKPNGKAAPVKAAEPDDQDEEATAKLSVSSIRNRLAGRKGRPTTGDDD